MNLVNFKNIKSGTPECPQECPKVQEEGYNAPCDILEFKKILFQRNLPCRDENGECCGCEVRKIMYRKDNPEHEISKQKMEEIADKVEKKYWGVARLFSGTSG